MRKRIEPVGIPRIHAGEDVNEGFMMDPEASVSALAFIHPDCSYFSVGEEQPSSPQSIHNKLVTKVFWHWAGAGAPQRDKVLPHGGSRAGHTADGRNASDRKLLV
jgi:hypothetical protein